MKIKTNIIFVIITSILTIILISLIGLKAYPLKRDIPTEITGLEGETIEVDTPLNYKATISNTNVQITNGILNLYKPGTTEINIKDGLRKYKINVTINQLPGTRVAIYDHNGEPYTNFKAAFSSTDGTHVLQTLLTNEIVIADTVKDNTQTIAMFEDKPMSDSIYLVNIRRRTPRESTIDKKEEGLDEDLYIDDDYADKESEKPIATTDPSVIIIGDLVIEPIEGATYIKNNRVYVKEEITNRPFEPSTNELE